ncbi:aldehyde dehydrogenase (NADP(+)) [Streptomyces canus]|uniref:aldehyde dehydrogenase (NADP(+)) n=1 Tax=Streptomyces canus TaxID=58343 RepID=UPI003816E9FE
MSASVLAPKDVLAAAAGAARPVARATHTMRAAWLHAIAAALDAHSGDLIPVAMRETHLPEGRLTGELARTTFQLRLLADRLAAGALSDNQVDHADPDWPIGPRPDLRRTHVPLGPVLVFAASNFPFAFSVAGGDTASALAAGCPVVLKAHPGHPDLSRATADLVLSALTDSGAPDGTFGLIEGHQAGAEAVGSPIIKGVAFTGSTAGGRALFDLAMGRPEPIPFYGELGSTNPVVVTPRGWANRPDAITTGFAGSVMLGAGQFCTKPGLIFVPHVDEFLTRLPDLVAGPLLNDHIAAGFLRSVKELAALTETARGAVLADEVSPVLFRTSTSTVREHPEILDLEAFGPASVLIEYEDLADVLSLVDLFPGQLTATVQGSEDADPGEIELVARLAEHAGRVLWNDWPTGVAVTDAQQHGGPYPASTAPLSTSVGTASVARFLRPVAFQGVPSAALPSELRDTPNQENTPS